MGIDSPRRLRRLHMRRRILVTVLLTIVAAGVVAGVIAPEVARRKSTKPMLQPGKVSLVGDSLNLGVEPYLQEELQGWQIETDDVVGRSTATGIEHLRAQRASLGSYVVVSLGTNDPVDTRDAFRAGVSEALVVAGAQRCVVWATIRRDGDTYEPFDQILRDASAGNRNLRLVEWTSMIRAHPDWLAGDGIHASSDGYKARAKAIVDAMRTCPRRA
jgi:lysophospholipase L1-like esterase